MAPHQFVYIPLDRSKSEIRLIELLPSRDLESDIECDLIHAPLDLGLQYEALSYTWGDWSDSSTVVLDGRRVPVTRNLNQGLRALRHTGKTRWLWVDALCIDQQNIEERNCEVPRIRQIYAHAQRVIVWLGEATQHSHLAINHLEDLSNRFYKGHSESIRPVMLRWVVSALYYYRLLCYYFPEITWPSMASFFAELLIAALRQPKWHFTTLFRSFGLAVLCYNEGENSSRFMPWVMVSLCLERYKSWSQGPEKKVLAALADLFGRPWFQRIWVIQEIAMSRSAVLVIGCYAISWERISAACQMMENISRETSLASPYVDTHYERLHDMRRAIFHQGLSGLTAKRSQLLSVLSCFSHYQSTDARDRIYGILSLADDLENLESQAGPFVPDYGASVEEVYTRLVIFVVSASHRLDIFFALKRDHNTTLPSWVPDWRESPVIPPSLNHREVFHLNSDNIANQVAEFSKNGRFVKVRGFVVGQVIGEPLGKLKARNITLATKAGPTKTITIWTTSLRDFQLFLRSMIPSLFLFLFLWMLRLLLPLLLRLLPIKPSQKQAFLDAVMPPIERMSSGWEEEEELDQKEEKRLTEPIDISKCRHELFAWEPARWVVSLDAARHDGFLRSWCSVFGQLSQEGDLVCMLLGSVHPAILRWHENNFLLIGIAEFGDTDLGLPWWCQQEYSENRLSLEEFTLE